MLLAAKTLASRSILDNERYRESKPRSSNYFAHVSSVAIDALERVARIIRLFATRSSSKR